MTTGLHLKSTARTRLSGIRGRKYCKGDRIISSQNKSVPFTLLRQLAERNANSVSHSLSVSRIGLYAVADVAQLNIMRGPADGPGGVDKEELFLVGRHKAKQPAGLRIIIFIQTMVPVICSPFDI